jgi:hypothetical protein
MKSTVQSNAADKSGAGMKHAGDLREYLERGYIIIRQAIGSDQIGPIREITELFLERARKKSRDNSMWDTHRIPHPYLSDFVDSDTNGLYDLLVSDRILMKNCQLMRSKSVGINDVTLFTEPARKLLTKFQWHRDGLLKPTSQLPLHGLQADCQSNAPGLLTWSIAIHEDPSLWVVPGSNRRINNGLEQAVLDFPNTDEPLPGAVRCELAAGDAVVFDASMIHSGSKDVDGCRRTLNVNYRGFGGPVFPHNRVVRWKPDLYEHLKQDTLRVFSHVEELLGQEQDMIKETFRSIIDHDEPGFHEHLAHLHPGVIGRMACVVQLHKIALALWKLNDRSAPPIPHEKYQVITLDHSSNRWRTAELLKRFSPTEVNRLWQCFSTLDQRLRIRPGHATDSTTDSPGYNLVEMPRNFDIRGFISSWEQG